MTKKKQMLFAGAIIISAVCIIVVLVMIVRFFLGAVTIKTDLKYYEKLTNGGNSLLPALSEVENSEELHFQYLHKNYLLFESDAYTLSVRYTHEAYAKEKDNLEAKYQFQSAPIPDDIGGNKASQFSAGTFVFKLLSLDYSQLSYPKELIWIGTSDSTNEIVYIYYHDPDLDYIDTSFEIFLTEECGFKK